MLLATAAPGEGLYLHRIPTALVEGDAADAVGALRIRAFVARPAELAAWIPGARVDDDASVEIELTSYPEIEPGVAARHRRASFLIDFDDPAVRELRDELVLRHGAAPSPETLRGFTRDAIPEKSMDRGWDIASRVARSGAGDCTEHAVLLTALARALGWPSRVVMGIGLVRVEGSLQGFGHAWSEIHEGGRWLPLDATPIGDDAQWVSRVPLALLDDEGPGYLVALVRQMQRRWPRRIEIYDPTASAPRQGRGYGVGLDASPRAASSSAAFSGRTR